MSDLSKTISGEDLCRWTGKSDRWHRQMAKAGHFPPPIEGQYQLEPTMMWMLRYFEGKGEGQRETLNDLKGQKLKREIALADIKIENESGRLLPFEVVNEFLLRVGSLQKVVLCQKLEKELPPRADGQPIEKIAAVGREIADEVCEIFGTRLYEWCEQHEPKPVSGERGRVAAERPSPDLAVGAG